MIKSNDLTIDLSSQQLLRKVVTTFQYLLKNKKACFYLRKQAFLSPGKLWRITLFLRQPGYPFPFFYARVAQERIRGFVPPGSPEFTLSETLSLYNFKELCFDTNYFEDKNYSIQNL
jgi:hypothetical protein